MEVALISDIHGDLEKIELIGNQIKETDLVLVSGDITHFGKTEDAILIIKALMAHNPHVFAVSGNCDYPEVESHLLKEKISLHAQCKTFQDFSIIGCGGSLSAPIDTPNELSEHEIEEFLTAAYKNYCKDRPLLLVTHQPPFKTKLDRVMKMKHVGSRAVRDFIDNVQPLVGISGHIHESRDVEMMNETTLVNPGALKDGKWARMVLSGGNVEIFLENI